MCAKLCARPSWSAPDPCDDPSKHGAKDGKHRQWNEPNDQGRDERRGVVTQIPEQRLHAFTPHTPEGKEEEHRHKQSRQKSGERDSLWSGHVQLIAIGQGRAAPPAPSNPAVSELGFKDLERKPKRLH